MDWNRLMRALDAAGVERVERRRAAMIAGRVPHTEIGPDEWETFGQHDEIMNAWLEGNIDNQTPA